MGSLVSNMLHADDDGGFIGQSLEVFAGMQITLTWTIFETAIKDLWIAAVNSRTNTIGREMANLPEPGNEKSGRTIKLEFLEREGFDIRGKLGTVSAYKFDFCALKDAKKAYDKAF